MSESVTVPVEKNLPHVVGRLAPSPTGQLHLGHAFSLLVAWWSIRKQGGKIILRLDDVDVDRASEEHRDAVIEDLKWLGIDWDGQPRIASERNPELKEGAMRLWEGGHAFACVCTRKDLLSARGAPQQGVVEQRYPGTCRARFSSIQAAEEATGKEAGLRFISKEGMCEFDDGIFGKFQGNVAQQVGDFLILRRNKMPSYQLAVVLDDEFDGVNEVVRGSDLLDSTLRQLQLIDALGLQAPSYYHLPLICDHTGRRLSKRAYDLSLAELRTQGVTPQSIVSWAARCAGAKELNSPITAREAINSFQWDQVPRQDILLGEDVPHSLSL